LIEVLVATILVGVAIASLIGAKMSFTQANGSAMQLSTAEFLITQVRELTRTLPAVDPDTGTDTFGAEESTLADYDDIDDLDQQTYNPPIGIDRNELTDYAAYTQQITVQNVNGDNFEQTVSDHDSDFIRITVTVTLNSQPVTSASWIRANY